MNCASRRQVGDGLARLVPNFGRTFALRPALQHVSRARKRQQGFRLAIDKFLLTLRARPIVGMQNHTIRIAPIARIDLFVLRNRRVVTGPSGKAIAIMRRILRRGRRFTLQHILHLENAVLVWRRSVEHLFLFERHHELLRPSGIQVHDFVVNRRQILDRLLVRIDNSPFRRARRPAGEGIAVLRVGIGRERLRGIIGEGLVRHRPARRTVAVELHGIGIRRPHG